MASRRAFLSSALRASAAVCPARPIFSVAVRTARPSLAPRAFAPFARSTRDYSVKTSEPKQWEFEELKNLVQKGANDEIVIVDVREPHELFETGKIPGAINIPITTAVQSFHIPEEDFEEMYGFERPSKDKELLFYCKAGIRAKSASQLANHAGWKKTSEYPGSWLDWAEHNGPVEKVKKY